MIHFYDSASPENIPSGSWASAYVTGYVWPTAEIDRMARVMRQSTRGDVSYMDIARGVDFESGNPISVADVLDCARRRRELGHLDFTLYVDEAYAAETGVVQALKENREYFRLWVAAWDGDPEARPSIDGVDAWAKQYANVGTRFDLSVIYGRADFERP